MMATPIHLPERTAKRLGLWYDAQAAERAVSFFERVLRHSQGRFAGRPFELLGWQADEVVRPLFGWKRADGTRRFRRGSIWVPKKNGKTTLAAGIELYLLVGDGEPGAQVYSAAVDREQASLVFREAANMVRQSPELSKRVKVLDATKTMKYDETHSFFRALSADAPTKEGLNTHGLVIDELHAHKSRVLFNTLFYSGAARTQPLQISISTAGEYDPESVGWHEYSYAKRVLAAPVDDPLDWEYFAFVAEADDEDDWTAPSTWAKANPSLGETIKLEDMESDCRRAQEDPSLQNQFRRYRLNLWTHAEKIWFLPEVWKRGGGKLPDLTGWRKYGGLDLASTKDTNCYCQLFESPDRKQYAVLNHYFLPKEGLRRRIERDRAPYDRWAEEGWITLTEGNVMDFAVIREHIKADALAAPMVELGYDPWHATQLALELQGEGIEVVPIRQGYQSLGEAVKKMETLVHEGSLLHGGDPVLAWMINNVVLRTDPNENRLPDKSKSTGRIDGVAALLDALAVAIKHQDEGEIEVYTPLS